jgi:hypothetical protein
MPMGDFYGLKKCLARLPSAGGSDSVRLVQGGKLLRREGQASAIRARSGSAEIVVVPLPLPRCRAKLYESFSTSPSSGQCCGFGVFSHVPELPLSSQLLAGYCVPGCPQRWESERKKAPPDFPLNLNSRFVSVMRRHQSIELGTERIADVCCVSHLRIRK